VVIEPPFCRPPVTPLSVPVTEPRPVLDPVLEPLLLLPSPLEPVLAGLLACIGPLAWIMLLPVVDEDPDEVPQDAPMTLATAATSPDTGRARPQRTRWPS
jgi:hypothetical protein